METPPKSKVSSGSGAQPRRVSRLRRPQDSSRATPRCQRKWVDSVSLGNSARSTSATRQPRCARSIASDAPAQRAPTMATSYMPPADRYRSILQRDAWTGMSANRYPSLERLDVARLKRLATNAPVSAFHLFDDDPRDLTHVG